ncbi:hypothetical protein [Natronobeatus ordinarius]|uniref:hypothetical protein n=1 Tax=Natronobeatus ordinarius TaxID=2963433 RepID=UPI0020CBF617|nr:hypothetical protein [Natronobeatus ordinarius]
MATTRTVVLASLIVLCALTIAPVALAFDAGLPAVGDDGSDDEPTDSKPMGADVSAFMQSTAADSSASVDGKLFASAYENADEDEREAVIADRTEQLEQRLASLEAERDELRDQQDDLNPVAYDARMSRLAVQIDGLERAIDDAAPRAAKTGVGVERLEALRNQTANASGPKVAAAAEGLAGVDPPRGPPGHVGDRDGGPPDGDDERGGPPDGDDERGGPPDGDDERGGPPADNDDRGGPPSDGDERGGPPADNDDREGPPSDGDDREGPPSDGDDRGGPPSDGDDREGPPADNDDRGGPPSDGDDRGGPPSDGDDRGGPPSDGDDRGGPPTDDETERGGGPSDTDETDRGETTPGPGGPETDD